MNHALFILSLFYVMIRGAAWSQPGMFLTSVNSVHHDSRSHFVSHCGLAWDRQRDLLGRDMFMRKVVATLRKGENAFLILLGNRSLL